MLGAINVPTASVFVNIEYKYPLVCTKTENGVYGLTFDKHMLDIVEIGIQSLGNVAIIVPLLQSVVVYPSIWAIHIRPNL